MYDALETDDCVIGAGIPEREIVRAVSSKSAALHCNQYGEPAPSVKWFIHPGVFIGSYDPISKKGSLDEGMDEQYDILPGSFSFYSLEGLRGLSGYIGEKLAAAAGR